MARFEKRESDGSIFVRTTLPSGALEGVWVDVDALRQTFVDRERMHAQDDDPSIMCARHGCGSDEMCVAILYSASSAHEQIAGDAEREGTPSDTALQTASTMWLAPVMSDIASVPQWNDVRRVVWCELALDAFSTDLAARKVRRACERVCTFALAMSAASKGRLTDVAAVIIGQAQQVAHAACGWGEVESLSPNIPRHMPGLFVKMEMCSKDEGMLAGVQLVRQPHQQSIRLFAETFSPCFDARTLSSSADPEDMPHRLIENTLRRALVSEYKCPVCGSVALSGFERFEGDKADEWGAGGPRMDVGSCFTVCAGCGVRLSLLSGLPMPKLRNVSRRSLMLMLMRDVTRATRRTFVMEATAAAAVTAMQGRGTINESQARVFAQSIVRITDSDQCVDYRVRTLPEYLTQIGVLEGQLVHVLRQEGIEDGSTAATLISSIRTVVRDRPGASLSVCVEDGIVDGMLKMLGGRSSGGKSCVDEAKQRFYDGMLDRFDEVTSVDFEEAEMEVEPKGDGDADFPEVEAVESFVHACRMNYQWSPEADAILKELSDSTEFEANEGDLVPVPAADRLFHKRAMDSADHILTHVAHWEKLHEFVRELLDTTRDRAWMAGVRAVYMLGLAVRIIREANPLIDVDELLACPLIRDRVDSVGKFVRFVLRERNGPAVLGSTWLALEHDWHSLRPMPTVTARDLVDVVGGLDGLPDASIGEYGVGPTQILEALRRRCGLHRDLENPGASRPAASDDDEDARFMRGDLRGFQHD